MLQTYCHCSTRIFAVGCMSRSAFGERRSAAPPHSAPCSAEHLVPGLGVRIKSAQRIGDHRIVTVVTESKTRRGSVERMVRSRAVGSRFGA